MTIESYKTELVMTCTV